jgi:D-amino peptidase
VAQGCQGAGTGTVCFGWKGGIGSSSRRLPENLGGWTLGVLVQTNFGGVLQLPGRPLGIELGQYYLKDQLAPAPPGESIMIILASDAPLSRRSLERLARRALGGLARTGASLQHGSGDYAIAFSTHLEVRRTLARCSQVYAYPELPHDGLSPLFQAAIEATEEAIYNSLFYAETTTGFQGHTARALWDVILSAAKDLDSSVAALPQNDIAKKGIRMKKETLMKIYISADIEGVTGATDWNETDKAHASFTEFSEQMTAEVAAACQGALAAGASEILVKDAHWTGRNLLAARLPRQARLVRGWMSDPYAMMAGLDESFDAALMIGYHSRAGSAGSPLAHTMSGRVVYVKINGLPVAEFTINSYTAAWLGVPVVFLSGDAALCQDASAFLPGLTTVAVKEGIGEATVNIHPELAVERIRDSVEQALKGDLGRCRVPLPAHFEVELRYKDHAPARQISFYPGAKLLEPHVVQFAAEDYFEVLRFFHFAF